MKYFVNFQEYGKHGRPIDHRSASDFETEGAGMLPNVGDYVLIEPVKVEGATRYAGRVRSRLFRYTDNQCEVNIVVENTADADWGGVIKE